MNEEAKKLETSTTGDIMAEIYKAAETSTIKGSLGFLTATRGIVNTCATDPDAFADITAAVNMYFSMNWGDTHEEDKPLNDAAAKKPGSDRIVARYITRAGDIFIITEYDRSRTTVLFASEY